MTASSQDTAAKSSRKINGKAISRNADARKAVSRHGDTPAAVKAQRKAIPEDGNLCQFLNHKEKDFVQFIVRHGMKNGISQKAGEIAMAAIEAIPETESAAAVVLSPVPAIEGKISSIERNIIIKLLCRGVSTATIMFETMVRVIKAIDAVTESVPENVLKLTLNQKWMTKAFLLWGVDRDIISRDMADAAIAVIIAAPEEKMYIDLNNPITARNFKAQAKRAIASRRKQSTVHNTGSEQKGPAGSPEAA